MPEMPVAEIKASAHGRSVCGRLNAAILVTLLCGAMVSSGWAEPVRILPVGDSLTTGAHHHVSFRYPLYFLLKDAGYDVDFVGGESAPYDSPNLDWYPRYETEFDPNHQGIWGARSDEMVSAAIGAASRYHPDIVLLQAGSNDIWLQGAGGVINAKFGITDIIEGVRSVVPGATFVVSLCTPVRANGFFAEQAPHVGALNEMIRELGPALDRPDSPVIVVDVHTGFDLNTMLQGDGGHHSLAGEAFVAERKFEILSQILPEPGTEEFGINQGHAGAWYTPSTAGQGLMLEVEPATQFLFMAWFTYAPAAAPDAGQQHWFTAQGEYQAARAELTVYETVGGAFDDPAAVQTTAVGEATLEFSDCTSGELSYRIDSWGKEGSIPIERVISGTDNLCRSLDGEAQALTARNDGWDGAWYDSDAPGQGMLMDVQTDSGGEDFLFVAWFTYGDRTDTGQWWLTAQGPLIGSTAEISVYETTGGRFNDTTPVSTQEAGSLQVDFTDCSNARISYSLDQQSLQGSIDMTRVIQGSAALCEGLQ